MLRPRLIVSLLVHRGGLVKTRQFGDPKYVGDPVNAVRIFNEKEVDELIVTDIDATRNGSEPNFDLIARLANECRMPLCYGGGVRDVATIDRIIDLGVEKVALSASIIADPGLISAAAAHVGAQSIVAVMDVKKTGLRRRYEVVTLNATVRTGVDPVVFARQAESAGAGEIVVNSVDRDGMMGGYDLDLLAGIRDAVSLPITSLGGAGSLEDIRQLYSEQGLIGAAAGSLFVFKGKYRAVLINYPNRREKAALMTGLKPA